MVRITMFSDPLIMGMVIPFMLYLSIYLSIYLLNNNNNNNNNNNAPFPFLHCYSRRCRRT
jgi:hypothetical protein